MRILVIGLNFAPELTGVGKYTGEMAAWLARRGHRITVVAALPYYPSWRIAPGYRGWAWRKERWEDCVVIRCPLYVPRQPSGPRRLAHLASFAVTSIPAAIAAALAEKPDIVAAVAPTLLSSPLALAVARLTHAKSWLHLQDFEVEAAYRLGQLHRAGASHAAAAFERGLVRRFDLVSSISVKMVDRLAAKGVAGDRRFLFPNWVDTDLIHPLDRASPLRRELQLPEDRAIALYAGSLGEKQGLEMLTDAARSMTEADAPLVLIAGDGPARPRLEAMAQGIPNLRFIGLQPSERLNDLLNLADIHLLPQRADVADLVMPSKLGPMLASGRPVIATAARGTQLATALGRSGIAVPPGDVQALARAILGLAKDPRLRHELGEAARQQARAEFGAEAILHSMEKRITALAEASPVAAHAASRA